MLAVAADPALTEEDRPAAVELDRDRDRRSSAAPPRAGRARPRPGRRPASRIVEERVRAKRFTPITVTPCRSSNSTEEPTTSSRRGRTLTLTPTASSVRTRSSICSGSTLSGATIARCTSSDLRPARGSRAAAAPRSLPADQREASAGSIAATSSALRPWWFGELGADRLAAIRLSPMKRQRSTGADAQRERSGRRCERGRGR